jgi:hypothetical protein
MSPAAAIFSLAPCRDREEENRDLSIVSIANMIARAWMWECDYGFAKHYTNFMGPLLCTNANM